ncbi:MAG: endonuclease NucS domain-containing protein [Candidatus Acidiferrales bacterium]
MVEFERTVGQGEANSWYLNLSDDQGTKYGSEFTLPHCTKVKIQDRRGRLTNAQIHHKNQLWGTLKDWFHDNNISAGTRVLVRFDSEEKYEGLPVIHLEGLTDRGTTPIDSVDRADIDIVCASEIPIELERQLEEFLAKNPELVEPGLTLYRDEGGNVGKQYPTDVGVIDLLCRRRNGQLLVIELKRSRISDVVVGQISRYIGWVKKNISRDAEVRGLILCHDRDDALKYAVYANPILEIKYFRVRLELIAEEQL